MELKKIGVQLAKRRNELHLEQDELAAKCGLSKQTISNIETGRFLRLNTILIVMAALGVKFSDTLFEEIL